MAFQPVRDRVQRLANRLVYGQRATPYEVLSEFSSRMAQSYAAEDLLPRMARILAEGTGAKSTVVWLRVKDALLAEAAWPPDDLPAGPLPMAGDTLPALSATLALPVEHGGELLGALSLTKPAGERLTPAEEHLARDLASGAGLVLRNVRLTEELLARLDELQASRQRLVADQGLVAALAAQARRAPFPAEVLPDGVSRYPQEQEAAVYFCVLEALQNVAKHAGGSRAMVRLEEREGQLTFAVSDDGAGFHTSRTTYGTGLQGMADRLAALGGELELTSGPGEGTTVLGRLPVQMLEPVG